MVTASDIRQVPDHQEVFLDKDGLTSIMFDITERVDSVANDQEALKYHLDDILESSGQAKVWSSTSAKMPRLPYMPYLRPLRKGLCESNVGPTHRSTHYVQLNQIHRRQAQYRASLGLCLCSYG